jgi:hypothetical protein
MPKISETPIKYTMPTPGDVWQKELNDGEWEHGIVVGVKPRYFTEGPRKGEMSSWTAHITSGFRDYRQDVAWDKTYQITEQWHPAPAEMQIPAAVRGLIAALGDEAVRLGDRLLALETAPAALGDAQDKAAFLALDEQFTAHCRLAETDRRDTDTAITALQKAIAAVNERINAFDHPAPEPVAAPAPAERPRRGGATA